MTLNVNQFQQSDVQGRLDNRSGASEALSCMIDASSGGGLVPGQAVKLKDVVGQQIMVVECAANSDDVFGFIILSPVKNVYAAGDYVEVLISGIMLMTASAAMARGAKVAVVIAGQQIVTAATGYMIVGRLLDKATASGQIVRVRVICPGSLAP